ncbi:MAG: biotin-dependent carboxyltransferase family protein [Anaerolineae bacterium]|nr:biotin-dependent carboxyltransferase family protein [Anaerolineae bacterium]
MLRVVAPGVLCTVQDLGRSGYQRFGVPVGGAMDRVACAIANRLVGNLPTAACVEITGGGAVFEVVEPCVVAVTGADLGATLNGQPLPMWLSVYLTAGRRVAFEGRRSGARAYLALAGGVDAPLVLGSRSTYLPGGFGGLGGRGLQMDDVLRPVPGQAPRDLIRLAGCAWPVAVDYALLIRILPFHDPSDLRSADLTAHPWRVGASSNRIGLRLEGPPIQTSQSREVISFGVFPGVIQLPPDGQPILLMADAQPTGGYPVVAVVIQADLHRAAQALPGDELRFAWTTIAEATQAWRELQRLLALPVEEDDGTALAAASRG